MRSASSSGRSLVIIKEGSRWCRSRAGIIGWVYGPVGVKREAADYYKRWMGHGRVRWYKKGGRTHPIFAEGNDGRAAQEQAVKGECDLEGAEGVPAELRQFSEFAAMKEGVADSDYSALMEMRAGRRRLKEIPPWYWDRHFSKVAKGKAAGPSGLQAEMISKATPAIRELLRMASNTGLLTQIYTDAEKTCYIHPVPKGEPGDYRPLRLCEVIVKAQRKWLITGCYKVWQDKWLLHKNNYGFKPSMSTDMALR